MKPQLQLVCQLLDVNTGQRSMPFSGTYPQILGALTKIKQEVEKESPGEVDNLTQTAVLVVWEKFGDDEGFVSRRPLLSWENFHLAIQTAIKTEAEPGEEQHAFS